MVPTPRAAAPLLLAIGPGVAHLPLGRSCLTLTCLPHSVMCAQALSIVGKLTAFLFSRGAVLFCHCLR